ncbi:MAG: radical SAM protein [Nitrososphaerales archaeon]
MKILLCKCPRAYVSHFEENSETLALGYLAATLRSAGFTRVDILDGCLMRMSLEEMVATISEANYDLIGFTISDQTFLESTFECINPLRAQGVKAHIVLGGYTPSFQYTETLQTCKGIDSVVRFEGEYTLLELATRIRDGLDWKTTPGIAYREGKKTCANDLPLPKRNLDELPFPSRDCLPYILTNLPETGAALVSGSRGCYANCSFCSVRAFYDAESGPPIRLRSVKSIVNEIEMLVKRFGVWDIFMVDDVFVIPNKMGIQRIEEFGEEFEKRNLHVMLSISERVCNVTDEICTSLRDMGVRQVLIGIEAGSNELLEYYNKKTTIDQNSHAVNVLDRLDIDPTVSFINFAPVTTLEQLRQNLYFLLNLRVNFLQGLLNRFQIHAGTALGEEVLKNGKIKGEFSKYDFIAEDPRTDLAYDIMKRSLGLFLTIAFELKRVQRNLRKQLFQAELYSSNLYEIRKARSQLKDLQQSIMVDAAEIFESVLDFADRHTRPGRQEIENFIDVTRERVRGQFANWSKGIAFLELFSPYVHNNNVNHTHTEKVFIH